LPYHFHSAAGHTRPKEIGRQRYLHARPSGGA
jgi:hypothetical protein